MQWIKFPNQYGWNMDVFPSSFNRIRISIRLWNIKTGQQKAKLDGHSSTICSICYSPDGTTLASGCHDNSIRLLDVKTGQQIIPSDYRQKDMLAYLTLQRLIVIFFQKVVFIFHYSSLPLILPFQKFATTPIQKFKELKSLKESLTIIKDMITIIIYIQRQYQFRERTKIETKLSQIQLTNCYEFCEVDYGIGGFHLLEIIYISVKSESSLKLILIKLKVCFKKIFHSNFLRLEKPFVSLISPFKTYINSKNLKHSYIVQTNQRKVLFGLDYKTQNKVIEIRQYFKKKQMHNKKEQVGELYKVLALFKQVDEVVLPILINILKNDRIQDCLEFLSQDQNKFLLEIERQNVENLFLLDKQQTLNGEKNIKRITDILKKIRDHEFNKQNYSTDDYEVIKKDLIVKISWDNKIIDLLKFLVHLTALDERYTQCGSNSLHLLVQMKADVREQSFENIKIRDSSLVGGNFVGCNFNESEFDNVDISGINLNQAQMFNCKWKNIKIHELNILDGHYRKVYQVCFSSDGKSLASCSDDNSIILWDVQTGKKKFRSRGKWEVKQLCFSPNNNTLVFSSQEFLYLLNLRTGKQKVRLGLEGHTKKVMSINFSPDGTILASSGGSENGGGDYTIHLWDVKTGQQKAKLDGHSSSVMSVNFSPDGTTVASGSSDNSIRLWDVKTGQSKVKLYGHSSSVMSVNFSPDGTTLASSSGDKSIRLWDAKTGQQKAKLDGHSDYVKTICYSPDGTTLASGSDDKSIRLWDVMTGQLKAQLDGHQYAVNSIFYSPDGTTLASGSSDNSIRLWDVKTGQSKAKLYGHSGTVYKISYSPDGTTLASGSSDKSICLWDAKTGQQKAKFDGHSNCVNSICYSPDGATLASGSDDMSIRLWDVKTGQQTAKLDGHSRAVYSICYSPDGTTLASGSLDKSIRLWDFKTGQSKAKLDGHSGTVYTVSYSPDGTILASGSSDKSICLWDVKTGQSKVKLYGHSNWVNSICYSPDGATLASGSDDMSIRLWDVKTGQQTAKLDGHSGTVYSIFYSPDGTALASGSDDMSIRLWDVKKAKEFLPHHNFYQHFLSQFKLPLQNQSILTNIEIDCTILRICQNSILEAQGAFILQGVIKNYSGYDLKPLFKSKGGLILENFKELQQD
ncbi:unnamed protein product [Paramecium octaurelia]|uniref:WD-40 repeat protein n=1 Tax=Paramecium octaurelia TaxID=43137 RepID=A0A8S1SB89_PAROT|nr:unnamed protein product [Paramecium octaurelia]